MFVFDIIVSHLRPTIRKRNSVTPSDNCGVARLRNLVSNR